MSWTAERIETLKKLWLDGQSAGQIATELGALTRNAVIGKIHRLGLSGRVRNPKEAERKQIALQVERQNLRDVAKAEREAAKPDGRVLLRELAEKRAADTRAAMGELDPDANPIPLLALRDNLCKWPLGDPRDEGFGFCGVEKGYGPSPYCRKHHALSYTPRTAGRREVFA